VPANSSTSDNLADIGFEQLDLTTRARNCLIRQRISKVGQLASLSASDILRWHSLGRKTLQELRELLGSLGLKLNGDPEPIGPVNLRLLQQLSVSPTISSSAPEPKPLNVINLGEAAPPSAQADNSTSHNLADIELEQLDLTTRARNCLIQERISKVGQLASLSASDILRWRNSGRKTLQELRELLGSLGLKLNGDPEPVGPVNLRLLQQQLSISQIISSSAPGPKPLNVLYLGKAAPQVQMRLVARLKLFSLSGRARNLIVQQRLVYLGELVQLKRTELFGLHPVPKTPS
jgi:RNA polymerase alpha subunit